MKAVRWFFTVRPVVYSGPDKLSICMSPFGWSLLVAFILVWVWRIV